MSITRLDDSTSIEDAERWNAEMERRELQEDVSLPPTIAKKRGKKKIKYVNFVPLRKEVFDIFIGEANKQGLRLSDFVAKICEDIVNSDLLSKIVGSDSFQLRIMQHRMTEWIEQIEVLEAGAAEYNQHPSEELAHILVQQCDRLGLEFDEVIERVKDDPVAQVIGEVSGDPDSVGNRCCKWLARLMRTNGYKIDARNGNRLANEQGFGRDHVRSARRRLGIRSIRIDKDMYHWVWSESHARAASIFGVDQSD